MNPMFLEMMATLGGSTDPEGPAGAIGNTAQQWIQRQQYMNMMKSQLSGEALASMKLADVSALTPEMMSSVMKTMLGQREVSRKSLSDAYDAMYKTGMLADTGKRTKIQEGQLAVQQGQLKARIRADTSRTRLAFAKLSKPEKTTLMKEFELQKSQDGYQNFNDWFAWRAKQVKSGIGEKTPSLLNYGQARRSLTNRYSSMNSTGQFVITPGLEAANAYAMERFADYSKAGLSPGDAENRAYRDTQSYQAKSIRMSNKLIREGRESEIPDMLRELRRYK